MEKNSNLKFVDVVCHDNLGGSLTYSIDFSTKVSIGEIHDYFDISYRDRNPDSDPASITFNCILIEDTMFGPLDNCLVTCTENFLTEDKIRSMLKTSKEAFESYKQERDEREQ